MNEVSAQGIGAISHFLKKGSNFLWKVVFMINVRLDEMVAGRGIRLDEIITAATISSSKGRAHPHIPWVWWESGHTTASLGSLHATYVARVSPTLPQSVLRPLNSASSTTPPRAWTEPHMPEVEICLMCARR